LTGPDGRHTRGAMKALFALTAALLFSVGLAACGPKYPKCDNDDQCKAKGELCVSGQCQQCRDDAQCSAGQQCKAGRCEAKPECAGNGDCKDGKICRSGKCQLECSGNGDCGAGMKCRDARCVDAMSCVGPSDCGAGMKCNEGRCAVDDANRGLCTMPTVAFGYDSSDLTPDARKALQDAVACFKQSGGTIVVEGHCDERGTEEYNLALGDRRAQAVERFLVSLGVQSSRISSRSKGELEPVDQGHDEAAWAKNRRVIFVGN